MVHPAHKIFSAGVGLKFKHFVIMYQILKYFQIIIVWQNLKFCIFTATKLSSHSTIYP